MPPPEPKTPYSLRPRRRRSCCRQTRHVCLSSSLGLAFVDHASDSVSNFGCVFRHKIWRIYFSNSSVIGMTHRKWNCSRFRAIRTIKWPWTKINSISSATFCKWRHIYQGYEFVSNYSHQSGRPSQKYGCLARARYERRLRKKNISGRHISRCAQNPESAGYYQSW